MSVIDEIALSTEVIPSEEEVQAELDRVIELRGSLFDIEKEAKDRLDTRRKALEKSLVLAQTAPTIDYPRLDPEVLSMREPKFFEWVRKEGFFGKKMDGVYLDVPRVAVYSLLVPHCRFHIDRKTPWDNWEVDVTPVAVQRRFSDVTEQLMREAKRRQSKMHLYSQFKGVIPRTSREAITKARSTFGSQIYLFAEPDWKLHVQKLPDPPALTDPLIVGFKADSFWLIDRFDPTPFEDYIAEEFASSNA